MTTNESALLKSSSRREFILSTGAMAAAVGAPPAFGRSALPDAAPQQESTDGSSTQPQAEPDKTDDRITVRTIAEAEKLAGVQYTPDERKQMVGSINEQIDVFARRMEHFIPPNELAPAMVFDPRPAGFELPWHTGRVSFAEADHDPLPQDEADIAFAPIAKLSMWLRRGAITSTELTRLYLERLKEYGPKLECIVTLLEDEAMEQAARADGEIAAGRIRSTLHGIPWGAKDLLDTAGTPTTWGATPYRDRIGQQDAEVVRRLDEAGAVLVAKLTLGALAYGDIWFGGRTNSPWNLEQGSSGSSAGSAAATAAGLVGFSIGTETYGSIVSPCMRCGTTGLRPTFGRVPRTGAMALCWSLDKIGPICRTVDDTMHVLVAINGADAGDPSSLDVPLRYDATQSARGLRIGYDPKWFEGDDLHAHDQAALDLLEARGVKLVQTQLPEWEYDALLNILLAEAASAFETITLNNTDDDMVWQDDRAWPNSFRQARFIPAIEYVQADRFRRQCMQMMAERFAGVDAMISPSFAGDMLLLTNNTGHPSLTIRNGFNADGTPHGITLWGRLFDEGTLCNLGAALEADYGVWDARPALERSNG